VVELPIGRRVAYWRGRRSMSQQIFADRLGKSKSWVDKVERGVRRLDKFSVVYDIADVLNVDVQLLMGRDPERRPGTSACMDQSEVDNIRTALERYEQVNTFHRQVEPPCLTTLRKSVQHAWMVYQHSRYEVLVRILPRLLRDAQAADAAYSVAAGLPDDGEGPSATHLLGQVYQIVSSAMRKLGELELAWLAADRSIPVAERSGDLLLAGSASYRVGNALLALGRARSALEVNLSIANRLATLDAETKPDHASVYGMLLLQGAMAAARIGDAATVRDLVAAAEAAARVVGPNQNHYWTSFGPINVELHRAAAHVELGEGGVAVETHEKLDPDEFGALPPERRAHHFVDLARGLAQEGDVDRASEMLLEGDRLAPSEIRCRPLVHEVLSDVLRRTKGTPSGPVAELAETMGVRV
jgi:transcriptional regulator with XRE-family HTH domain